jgi:AbiV family abortive infection protein
MKLALEEVSKSLILFELAMYKDYDIDCERSTKLYEAIEFHNAKTKYAFNFLISRQNSFIKHLPNSEVHNEESNQNKELNGLREMLNRVKELDEKKNTNLYTSLFETEFKPPFLSFEEQDVEDIRHLTYQLLVYAKGIVLEINNSIFESSEISKEVIEKLDAYQETRDMHKLITTYLNQM